jgi:hypothetical protein
MGVWLANSHPRDKPQPILVPIYAHRYGPLPILILMLVKDPLPDRYPLPTAHYKFSTCAHWGGAGGEAMHWRWGCRGQGGVVLLEAGASCVVMLVY